MQMVDRSGNTVDVPEPDVGAAFRSGQYGFTPGASVPTYNAAGGVSAIPADQFDPGKHFVATPEDWAAAQNEERYGGVGGSAAAFGIGAGNALTLGFGKGLATKAAGLVSPEAEEKTRAAIKGYTEQNPVSSFAGEAAGTIAPLALGGIEGVVGKGARGVGAGVRGLDAAGSLAEAGVRGIVGSEAEGALARAGQKAAAYSARGALEGGVYGAGGAYSDAALDNEDLTAERLMSGAKHGALMGGAIGAGIGAGTELAERAIQKVAGAVVPKIREAVEDFAEQRAFKAAGGSKSWMNRAMDRAGGAEEVSKDLLARGHITYTSTPESVAQSVAKDAEDTGAKLGTMMRDLDAKAATEGGKLVDGSTVVRRAYDEVVQPMLNNPAMRDVGEQMAKRLEPYVEDFAGNEVGHAKMWEIRRGLDQRISWESRAQSPLADGLKQFRGILEDELTTSADKAARELGVSDTFAKDWKETKRLYSSLSFARDMAEDAVARREGNRFFSLTDNLAGGFGASSFSHGAGEHGMSLLSMLNPQAALSGVLTAAAHKVLRERGSAVLATAMSKLAKTGAVADEALAVDKTVSDAVDKFLSRGVATSAKLAADRSDNIVARESGVMGAAARIFGNRAESPKAAKTLDGQYHDATRAITALASQPAAAQAHREMAIAPLVRTAPAMGLKVSQLQGRAIDFLQSKLPPQAVKVPLSAAPVRGVPDMAKAGFLRSLRAVQRPISQVEDLAKGKLSKEGVEALKAVYPETYQDLKTKVLDRVQELAANGEDVPYAQRLQIGRLFGVAVDPTQSPAFKASVKGLFAKMDDGVAQSPDQTGGGQAGGGAPRGPGGGRKVDTAHAIETRTDELEKGLS